MTNNLIEAIVNHGGTVQELLIPAELSKGLGLCNPSIYNDMGRVLVNLRNVEYTLYHSENQHRFQSRWGALAYLHPESDQHLRTVNFLCELNSKTFEVESYTKVDTSKLDVEPVWGFVGLEDARLVKWHGRLFQCGVRRDTTPTGIGRIEMSELVKGVEISRNRIEPPDNKSYCEKNWMPVIDMPFHFIKWTNPTELVRVDLATNTSEQILLVQNNLKTCRDLRGGSQVIPYKGFHIALTHEVDLYSTDRGGKGAQYYHRFIVWDKDWNIVHSSEEFKFFSANVEFGCGMIHINNDLIVTVGFQDNCSFIIRIPEKYFDYLVGITDIEPEKRYNTLSPLMESLVSRPFDEMTNFNLGSYYLNQGHKAAALSFYLRAAEHGTTDEIIYESLIKVAGVLGDLGDRCYAEEGAYLNVISFCPKRPEAYLLLSFFYERRKKWLEMYTTACIGESLIGYKTDTLTDIGYVGDFVFKFQKAVAAWWIGKVIESWSLFFDLCNNYKGILPQKYIDLVQINMTKLSLGAYPFLRYNNSMYDKLKVKFNDSKDITNNFSQSYQDMFVLSMLDGKRNGTYLEIGSADPFSGNNTALLETKFGWDGLSIEILKDEVNKFKASRKNEVLEANALDLNYDELLRFRRFPKDIDYLQVDCEPLKTTYEILTKIPFDKYRFAVITFEHDYYADTSKLYRGLSREFLLSKGYVLAASNIAFREGSDFEDWWVHPELISREALAVLFNDDDTIKVADKFMLN